MHVNKHIYSHVRVLIGIIYTLKSKRDRGKAEERKRTKENLNGVYICEKIMGDFNFLDAL